MTTINYTQMVAPGWRRAGFIRDVGTQGRIFRKIRCHPGNLGERQPVTELWPSRCRHSEIFERSMRGSSEDAAEKPKGRQRDGRPSNQPRCCVGAAYQPGKV